jgi:hypothetical protein
MSSRTLTILLAIALAGAIGYALGRTPGEEAATHAAPASAANNPHDSLPMDLPEEPEDQRDPPQSGEPQGMALPGVVLEHVDVSQYTYLHLATESGDTWAAVYRAPVKTGDKVIVQNAVRLEGFKSKELKREFAEIYFGTLPGAEVAPPLDAGGPKAATKGTAL